MTELSLDGRAGDLVVAMTSPQRNLTYATISAPAGTGTGPHNLTNVAAYPLVGSGNAFRLAQSGDEAFVNAFLLIGEAIKDLAAGSSTSGPLYTVLDDFLGVVLNEDAVQLTDTSEDGFSMTLSTITANAQDANGNSPKWVDEPENTSTQTD